MPVRSAISAGSATKVLVVFGNLADPRVFSEVSRAAREALSRLSGGR